jgi:hypothetical protein
MSSEWHSDICDCLELDAYLDTFVLAVIPQCLPKVPSTFSFPVFARLRALTLHVIAPTRDTSGRNDFFTNIAALFTEIADKSSELQHVVFANVAMDLGNLQCLSRLSKLQSITWMMQDGDEIDFIRGDGSPEEALGKVFESFESVPRIQIVRTDWGWVEAQVGRWPYEF